MHSAMLFSRTHPNINNTATTTTTTTTTNGDYDNNHTGSRPDWV